MKSTFILLFVCTVVQVQAEADPLWDKFLASKTAVQDKKVHNGHGGSSFWTQMATTESNTKLVNPMATMQSNRRNGETLSTYERLAQLIRSKPKGIIFYLFQVKEDSKSLL